MIYLLLLKNVTFLSLSLCVRGRVRNISIPLRKKVFSSPSCAYKGGGGRYSSIIMKTSKNVRHYKLKNPSNNKTKLPPYTYIDIPPIFFEQNFFTSTFFTVHTYTQTTCVSFAGAGTESPGLKCK